MDWDAVIHIGFKISQLRTRFAIQYRPIDPIATEPNRIQFVFVQIASSVNLIHFAKMK